MISISTTYPHWPRKKYGIWPKKKLQVLAACQRRPNFVEGHESGAFSFYLFHFLNHFLRSRRQPVFFPPCKEELRPTVSSYCIPSLSRMYFCTLICTTRCRLIVFHLLYHVYESIYTTIKPLPSPLVSTNIIRCIGKRKCLVIVYYAEE